MPQGHCAELIRDSWQQNLLSVNINCTSKAPWSISPALIRSIYLLWLNYNMLPIQSPSVTWWCSPMCTIRPSRLWAPSPTKLSQLHLIIIFTVFSFWAGWLLNAAYHDKKNDSLWFVVVGGGSEMIAAAMKLIEGTEAVGKSSWPWRPLAVFSFWAGWLLNVA